MPERLGPPRATPLFDRVALIGLGLIGSSIARAARHLNLARTIVAVDRDEAVATRVRELGITDEVTGDPAAGVRDADLVILCVPVGVCGAVAQAMRPGLKPGCIVSDVGSVKASVIAQVEPHLPEGVAFVPAHPVAGTEHSGPDAGFSTLFHNRWCILTPPDGTDEAAIERVQALWAAMGAKVEIMSAPHPGLVPGNHSHGPHPNAYNIVGTGGGLETVT